MEVDSETKLSTASHFLLQAPPGEVNDCLDDIRNIILDDDLLEVSILTALETYNTREFIVAELNGEQILITEAAKLNFDRHSESNRMLDPKSSTSFLFDHMKIATSLPSPFPTDPETESLRSELDKLFLPYVKNHYSDGVCAVYALEDEIYPIPIPVIPEVVKEVEVEPEVIVEEEKKEEEELVAEKEQEASKEKEEEVEVPVEQEKEKVEAGMSEEPVDVAVEGEVESTVEPIAVDPVEEEEEKSEPVVVEEPKGPIMNAVESRIFGLYLVGNKYNPTNFWTGRWKAVYTVDYHKNTIEGIVQINCHYYEQGNVQLATTLSTTTSFIPSSTPTQILSQIKTQEKATQTKISEIYLSLSEESFKGLRRALPKTRSKLDWGKIMGYKLGGELGNASVGTNV